ncbi:hypothetical protein RPMA_15410 [Tardiphaga alba]|uniref:Ricin B lectin domain-containing protein n=1 Tax=Tardiphaga alba TaxID=340268 RepID=A0ABX8A8Q7_9BRAD|nr:RICIN domain-containing protein [Tardiphaga alba]QUS40062.1 hypothetical protein RPMA_15410 [Tardiphaga alba]
MNTLIAPILALLALLTGASAQEVGTTYAIQNVLTAKNIRPFEAKKDDGNNIILYDHWSWKCMTWQFDQVQGNTYQLRNVYTSKTLEPSGTPGAMTALWQQPLGSSKTQYWDFISDGGETYLIRLKDTQLYVTISSEKTNSPIVLKPLQNSTAQKWRLIRQNPWF